MVFGRKNCREIIKENQHINTVKNMNSPEIEELRIVVEQKYGRPLNTSTDFDEFSLFLKRSFDMDISTSTLKRLWGYVNDIHKPRIITLDGLARFAGYGTFSDFKVWLKTNVKYNSSFINAVQLVSNDLKLNTTVMIGWKPNRVVHLRYIGNSRYEVIASENSKLMIGDIFMTGCFFKGQPLFLPFIERAGHRTSPFVAGRNGGITMINVILNKDE